MKPHLGHRIVVRMKSGAPEVSLRRRQAIAPPHVARREGTVMPCGALHFCGRIACFSRGRANVLTLSCKPPHVPTPLRQGGRRD
jgi:hypothetical protein